MLSPLAELVPSLSLGLFAGVIILCLDEWARRHCLSFAQSFKQKASAEAFSYLAGASGAVAANPAVGTQVSGSRNTAGLLHSSLALPLSILRGLSALACGFACALLFTAIFGAAVAAVIPLAVLIGTFYITSALKFAVLKEPLFWSDLLLIREVLLCPRFYFGYVNTWLLLALVLLFCALAGSELFVVVSCQFCSAGSRVSACFLSLLILGILLLLVNAWIFGRGALLWCGDVCLQGAVLGVLLGFLSGLLALWQDKFWPEALAQKQDEMRKLKPSSGFVAESENLSAAAVTGSEPSAKTAPIIVLVQAESLVSLARLQRSKSLSGQNSTAADVSIKLDNYLLCSKKAQLRGMVGIDYLGAYTMRSEFAALTGLQPKKLGAYCSDPYQLLRRLENTGVYPGMSRSGDSSVLGWQQALMPAISLASLLRQQGYRTLCLHLNSGHFFARNRLMCLLGFDDFICQETLRHWCANTAAHDEADGGVCVQTSTSCSDSTLGRLIVRQMRYARSSGQKLFVFAITMDGHGPYLGCDAGQKLASFADRQQGLSALVSAVLTELSPADRLFVYGDHMPPLPGFESLSVPAALKPDCFAFNFGGQELKHAGISLTEHDKATHSVAADNLDNGCNPVICELGFEQIHRLLLAAGGVYA